ncbi:hypothetical protein PR202_gb25434 [Eleusine coracana subsp. coracana]|uniref:Uncharacterized protein n=1 Tax=Eleusine coracana subsp. coracana TaxID=191504 RepID=A0AAV5FP71_ELECO|nr:hypothetical protein PR202_gb25434 [Eleusine coracana subsp. coracana]
MLPINALPKDLLCTIDDRLVLLYFLDNYLVLWSQTNEDGDGTLDWVPTLPVKVDMETGIHGELSPVCAGGKSGTILALYWSDPECAYMVDLQSGLTTKVSGWMRSFNYMTVVLYEINWPVFFMSRLGVQL